ncbi:hypothetical protein [Streptomyces jumonjinensis]|uniref:hypothetical protein n=1 Tax=Streptomyces jumonjinensis TaxID=1945 RepID=UPI0037A11248
MRTSTAAAITAALLLALTACGGGGGGGGEDSKPDAAACKDAMTEAINKSIDAGSAVKGADDLRDGRKPKPCEGLDDKTLEKITGEVTTAFVKDLEKNLESDAEGIGKDLEKELSELG